MLLARDYNSELSIRDHQSVNALTLHPSCPYVQIASYANMQLIKRLRDDRVCLSDSRQSLQDRFRGEFDDVFVSHHEKKSSRAGFVSYTSRGSHTSDVYRQ